MKNSSEIFVQNRQRQLAVDPRALEHFARRALPLALREKGRGLERLPEIHVLLVSDRRISLLHRRFMQVAGPTDVITFQHGEIFLSVETAGRAAAGHRNSPRDEIRLYLVHGLLHLHGFDDRAPAARERMHATQERLVAVAGG
ncbi:MAG: rRNA maturation RNase YbeY [Chthoniobacterales bacterium]